MGIYYGKSVEAAIDEALLELGISKEEAVINVIDEPQKGILGIGGKKAKVSVEKKVDDAKKAADFLDGIFNLLNIPAQAEVTKNDDKIVIDVITTTPTALIGYRGEMLDALQTLASAAANTQNDEYKKVVVNCENYREKREETLKNLASRLAEKAIKYGKKFALEPMNPFERKVIHSALADNEEVKTESQGVEPNRYIVIVPNNLKDENARPERYEKRSNEKRSNSRDRRGDKRGANKDVIKADKKTLGFGTFIGNSLKND